MRELPQSGPSTQKLVSLLWNLRSSQSKPPTPSRQGWSHTIQQTWIKMTHLYFTQNILSTKWRTAKVVFNLINVKKNSLINEQKKTANWLLQYYLCAIRCPRCSEKSPITNLKSNHEKPFSSKRFVGIEEWNWPATWWDGSIRINYLVSVNRGEYFPFQVPDKNGGVSGGTHDELSCRRPTHSGYKRHENRFNQ